MQRYIVGRLCPHHRNINQIYKYMKKILLLFAAAICAVASWAQDVVTAKYNGNMLDIELTNSTQFIAFQMDITLPADVTVTSITSNVDRLFQQENVVIEGEEVTTDFKVLYNVIDETNNVVRVIVYNLGNNEIKEATGKLITLNLNTTIEEATIDNILFVDNGMIEKALAQVIAEQGAKAGDVNLDGFVTLADAQAIFKRIVNLENNPSYNYDVDGNGTPTIADAILVYKIIVGLI